MSDATTSPSWPLDRDTTATIYWALPLFGKINSIRVCELFHSAGERGYDFEDELRARIGTAMESIARAGATLTGELIIDCLLGNPRAPMGYWHSSSAELYVERKTFEQAERDLMRKPSDFTQGHAELL